MKRIVVTGGAGFIGSNYVRYKLGASPDIHIVVFDKMTYAGNRENLQGLDASRYTFVQGDIADREAISAAMEGADAIVNFAAERIAQRLGNALVAPAVTYVPEGDVTDPRGHMNFAGTITLPQKYFVKLIV